jgi:predicted patatin/cPLA2 family phospholipase
MEVDAISRPDTPHPVLSALAERARNGSTPGQRDDAHRLALVIEGGGMRGVVSAGMTAALERLGLTRCFDVVVGASAGAFNGAGLIAGVAGHGPATYSGPMASRSFVNPARVLVGRPVIDVEYALDYASADVDAARHERVLESTIALHCIAVDVETARPAALSGMRTKRELWDALLASSRTPWAGGPPVEIGGRRYIDGGLGAAIPVTEALAAGATHVLVLQTRPQGVPRKSVSRIADRLIERQLRRLNPALVPLYRERLPWYERIVDDIARRSRMPGAGPPHVLGLRPPAGTPVVGQLERRAPLLAQAAADAERVVLNGLRPVLSAPAEPAPGPHPHRRPRLPRALHPGAKSPGPAWPSPRPGQDPSGGV